MAPKRFRECLGDDGDLCAVSDRNVGGLERASMDQANSEGGKEIRRYIVDGCGAAQPFGLIVETNLADWPALKGGCFS